MSSSSKEIGSTIAYFRNENGMSESDLAKACNLSKNRINKIEKGELGIRWVILQRICNALNVTMDEILVSEFRMFDIYDKIRPFLSTPTRNVLDKQVPSAVLEVKGEGGVIRLCRVRCLGLTVEMGYNIDSPQERDGLLKSKIKQLAGYLNTLVENNYLEGGRFGILRMPLARISPAKRYMLMAYVTTPDHIDNDKINELLGVDLAINEGEMPNKL